MRAYSSKVWWAYRTITHKYLVSTDMEG